MSDFNIPEGWYRPKGKSHPDARRGYAPTNVRVRWQVGCTVCESEMPDGYDSEKPYHQASARCENGFRSHCECDICF